MNEQLTVGMLRELVGNKEIPGLTSFLEGRPDFEELDLLNRNDYIATTLWDQDDIIVRAAEIGFKITNKQLDNITSSGMLKCLGDCQDSHWQILDDAILDQCLVEK